MKIKDLFNYNYGVNLELINCDISADKINSINFVARTSQNNGVVARVKKIEHIAPQKAGTLSLAVSGSVLSCFVQTEEYYSGRDLYVLTPKIELSIEQKLFYATAISKNQYRYSYGRAANKTFPNIEIPSIAECNKIIDNYKLKKISTKNKTISSINQVNWQPYKVSDLFYTNNIRGKLSSLKELEHGNIEVVSTTELNNGIIGKYNVECPYNKSICVSFNGACGYFSYHEKSFNATSDVGILKPKFVLNKYIAIFLITILNKMSYKFQYGRKLNGERLKDEIITLPTLNGAPNWAFMESYIISLPYADRL